MELDYCARSRRLEIQRSLEHENVTLLAIQDAMKKADSMTSKMSGILENFGTRLENLEKAVIPVHRQTKDLQRLQENTDKVLNAIDKVVSYHNVAKKNESVINQAPQGQLEIYCASMAELQTAVDFFKKNTPDSPELKKVNSLFSIGTQKMIDCYDSLIRRHSHADDPKVLEIAIKSKTQLDLEFPESALEELKKMSDWIFTNMTDKSVFIKVYATVREESLRQTLHSLRESARKDTAQTPRKNFTIRRSIQSRKSTKKVPKRKSSGKN